MEDEYVMVNGRKTIPLQGNKILKWDQIEFALFNRVFIKKFLSFIYQEDSFVYLNGHHLVLYDINKKHQFLFRFKDKEDANKYNLFQVVAMNHCVNDRMMTSVGLGLKNSINNYTTVRINKTIHKSFTLLHQYLPFEPKSKILYFFILLHILLLCITISIFMIPYTLVYSKLILNNLLLTLPLVKIMLIIWNIQGFRIVWHKWTQCIEIMKIQSN